MNSTRVGIMGGTFDPIHYGHLVTAEAARERYRLDKVIFVPSGRPPHKAPGTVSDFWHRYLMVLLAVVSNPCFEVSRLEYERRGHSYTIDSMREFRLLYGPDADLYFITGADAMLEIFSWKEPEELFSLCNFIVATRPGYDLQKLQNNIAASFIDKVSVLEIPLLSISSTDIRDRVKKSRSIRYLVPEAVDYYVHQNGVYRQEF